MNQRKMRIGMSIRGHGYHPAAWRHPDVPADGTLQVEHYVRSAQTAERGKLDMIFFADGAGIRQGDNPPGSLARTGRDMIELEPTMLLPALGVAMRCAAQNHTVSGNLDRCIAVPAVIDVWRPQSRHSWVCARLFNNAARPPPQAGQTNPSGQRRSNKNAAQLVSSGKLV